MSFRMDVKKSTPAHLMFKCMRIFIEKKWQSIKKASDVIEQWTTAVKKHVLFAIRKARISTVFAQVARSPSKTKLIWVIVDLIKKAGCRRVFMINFCSAHSSPSSKFIHFFAEKHKAYHAKNDELAKDGFRKYMKYEHCMFENCPYSKIMNHIHCIRNGKKRYQH